MLKFFFCLLYNLDEILKKSKFIDKINELKIDLALYFIHNFIVFMLIFILVIFWNFFN
jgi:hypothetical protein